MATILECPACRQKFNRSDKTATTVQCPHCSLRFAQPAEGSAAPTAAAAPAGTATPSNPRVGILVSKTAAKKEQAPSPPGTARLPTWADAPATAPAAGPAPTAVAQAAAPPLVPAPPPSSPSTLGPAPIVSSSGRRLTTLVRDAVEAVVSRNPTLARKGINELSVIALTLGMIALAITWPFRVPGFGLFVGGVGLVLGGLAFCLVLQRKAGDFVMPSLAALVNLQAFVMAIFLAVAPEPPRELGAFRIEYQDITVLRPALSSTDPDKRAKALSAVGTLASHLEATRADFLTALGDSDATVRAASAEALGRLGPPARLAYAVLVKVNQSDASETVRRQAQGALKRIGAPNLGDLPDFLALLKDADPVLRSAAALALGHIGPDAHDAIPALEKVVTGDADAGVRVSCAQAYSEIMKDKAAGIVVPVLISGLSDKTPAVRARAAAALGAMRSDDAEARAAVAKAVESLEAALRDDDATVRWEAAYALGQIGQARSAPAFAEALTDSEIKVRIVAAQALWKLERKTTGVPVLVQALNNSLDPDIRLNVVLALAKIGPDARAAVPALSKAVAGKEAAVRAGAAEALHRIGPDAKEALPALRELLRDGDPTARAQAAYALSGLAGEARPAAGDLRLALQDTDPGVRLFAARALWEIEEQAGVVLPVMTRILREEKDAVQRARAATLIGALKGHASSAVPDLLEMLHDGDAAVRAAAAKALGDIGGPQARVTYPALVELSKDEERDEHVRLAAAASLKKIGRATKADVDTLIGALDHKEKRFRAAAAVSLWLLNRDAKKAVSALSKKLADGDELVRTTVAFALAAIGPDAAAAVPELIATLKHDDPIHRGRVAYTLGEIGPPAKDAAVPLHELARNAKESLETRFQAARAYWLITQRTADVMPILELALAAEADDDVNLQAAELFAKIGPKIDAADKALSSSIRKTTVPRLNKLLDTGPDNVRAAVVLALGSLGVAAQESVPPLLKVLEEEDADLRALAAEALGRIGAAEAKANNKAVWARMAYSALLFFGRVDQNDQVRRAATGAMANIGVPGQADVDLFLTLLADKQQPPGVRKAAGEVLGILGQKISKNDIRRLGAVLQESEDASIQALAAYALGEVGPEAKSEAPPLLRALKANDAGLGAAAFALGEIFERSGTPEVVQALRNAADSPDENVKASAGAALKKVSP